jgi:hypothetical protein
MYSVLQAYFDYGVIFITEKKREVVLSCNALGVFNVVATED